MSRSILLVDDHQIFVTGLAELLDGTPGLSVSATANSGDEALQLAHQHRPDVMIVDIAMPGLDGISLTRQVALAYPGIRIICLSMHADAQLIASMFKAGVSAYLLKDCELPELLTAIAKVGDGDTYMSASVLKLVTESFRHDPDGENAPTASLLTNRERQVLVMLADGMTTKQIAASLGLSIKTIGTYREHLMDKLGIRSIAGLTKYAIREGLTSSRV